MDGDYDEELISRSEDASRLALMAGEKDRAAMGDFGDPARRIGIGGCRSVQLSQSSGTYLLRTPYSNGTRNPDIPACLTWEGSGLC